VVDIHAIASQNKYINWREIVTEAKSKEVGADPEVCYDILCSFPLKYLDTIRWIHRPDSDTFRDDITKIAENILFGKTNSLVMWPQQKGPDFL